MWYTSVMIPNKAGESLAESAARIEMETGADVVEPGQLMSHALFLMEPQPTDEQGRFLFENSGLYPTSCRVRWLDRHMVRHLRDGGFVNALDAAKAAGMLRRHG
jgi:hypothetical protein